METGKKRIGVSGEEVILPDKEYPLRFWYMCPKGVCTVIDVDEKARKVRIHNYVDNLLYRAFGCLENPTYEQYEKFLESRCFPRTRDKMKLMLKHFELPFYDPMLIIEKTKGRMAEDAFWYKADYTGYEGLAEYVVSSVLRHSTLDPAEYVTYETEKIHYRGIEDLS